MLLWSDHAFDTKALLQLAAACAQSYGFQGQPDMLYTYQTKRGVGLGTVVDWLLPYARVPSAKCPYMQILPFDSAPATATVCRLCFLSVAVAQGRSTQQSSGWLRMLRRGQRGAMSSRRWQSSSQPTAATGSR